MTALYRSSYRVVYVLTLSVALALIGLGLTSTTHPTHQSIHSQAMPMMDMEMGASTSP